MKEIKKMLLVTMLSLGVLSFVNINIPNNVVEVLASEKDAIDYFKDIENLSVLETGKGDYLSLYLIAYCDVDFTESEYSDYTNEIVDRFANAVYEDWFDYKYVMIDFWGLGESRVLSCTFETRDLLTSIQLRYWENTDLQEFFYCNGLSAEYLDCDIMTTVLGENVLVVHYEIKNDGDESLSFSELFLDKCYLNGVEIDRCWDYSSNETENRSKKIRPGTKIKVDSVFELGDETGEVVIEVSSYPDNEVLLEKTFEIEW